MGFKKMGDCKLTWALQASRAQKPSRDKILVMGRLLMHTPLTKLHDGVLFCTLWCPWILVFCGIY